MRSAIALNGSFFTAQRMLHEDVAKVYGSAEVAVTGASRRGSQRSRPFEGDAMIGNAESAVVTSVGALGLTDKPAGVTSALPSPGAVSMVVAATSSVGGVAPPAIGTPGRTSDPSRWSRAGDVRRDLPAPPALDRCVSCRS
jgi:hypothetical protein